MTTASSTQTGAGEPSAAPRQAATRVRPAHAANPLRALVALGKMPVVLELHLTEGDRDGYQDLRRRYLTDSVGLPDITFLGQFVRQLDGTAEDLTPAERRLVRKLQTYSDLVSSGKVDLIAIDDGARGTDALDNAVAAELLAGLGVDPARLIANVVARNRQADQIRKRLIHLADIGVRTALLLTGDLPADKSRPAIFPLDSIGMCELAREMLIEGVLPEDFVIAAAGHPNPDADPDGLRTLHKALAGAQFIITQAIFSVDLLEDWMAALRRLGVLDMVDVLAEVIPITSTRQLNALTEIPGIAVPTELVLEFSAIEQRLASTASAGGHDQQWLIRQTVHEGAKLTRGLFHRIRKVQGVSGFYLGCVQSFEAHTTLLKETPLVPEHAQGLSHASKLTGADRQRVLAQLPAVESVLDDVVRHAKARTSGLMRSVMNRAASIGAVATVLNVLEWPKVPLFGCKQCDRCDLSVDALICPRGCAKQMTHGPCGAPRLIDGKYMCEDTTRECTWAAIRDRRKRYGTPLDVQLSSRESPSPLFYEGKRFSAFLPVWKGEKDGPDWSLAIRAPLANLRNLFRRGESGSAVHSGPVDLPTLVASRTEQLVKLLSVNPEMDREELLAKALVLVGNPEAFHLVESRMVQFGLPAEGSLFDLSIRERFKLAEALPAVRARATASSAAAGSIAHCEELLSVMREGTQLRKSMRRELANGLIRHIGLLGVGVTYTGALLTKGSVEHFLQALTILKDELQIARHRLAERVQKVSVHFNRIQYKHHYRAPIAIRRHRAPTLRATEEGARREAGTDRFLTVAARHEEIVIDMKQFGSPDRFRSEIRAVIERLAAGKSESADAVLLEDFAGDSKSVAWSFNSVFWSRLGDFEKATGVNYDDSIGGSSDRNLDYVRSTARAYVDRLSGRVADSERLCVVEIGVASTRRAFAFLEELKRISDLQATGLYERTTYVLADYSESILQSSAAALREHHHNIEAVRIDAGDPLGALSPYAGRIAHIHVCNVYDNLPTDKVGWVGEQLYRIESRLYLPKAALESLVDKHGFNPRDADELVARLKMLTTRREDGLCDLLDWARDRLVEQGKAPLSYVGFWMDLFSSLRAEEQYVAIRDVDELPLGEVAGLQRPLDLLRGQFTGARSVRVHLNQHALAGFVQMLRMLHPFGTLEVVDLFVQRLEEYYERFKGPAKYDGSTVNWLNGPLFRAVAEQLGFSVRFHSFKPYDPKSVSVIMLASPQTDVGELEVEE